MVCAACVWSVTALEGEAGHTLSQPKGAFVRVHRICSQVVLNRLVTSVARSRCLREGPPDTHPHGGGGRHAVLCVLCLAGSFGVALVPRAAGASCRRVGCAGAPRANPLAIMRGACVACVRCQLVRSGRVGSLWLRVVCSLPRGAGRCVAAWLKRQCRVNVVHLGVVAKPTGVFCIAAGCRYVGDIVVN